MDRTPGRTRRHAGTFVIIGTALLAVLAGCSSSGNGSKTASGTARAAAAPNAAAQDAMSSRQDKGAAPAALPMQVAGDRAIVYNGTMTVRVPDVDTAAAQLAGFATGSGGYVSGDQRSSDANRSSATLTVRVPVDRFYGTVNQIGGLGKEQNRQISAEDVTAKLVDLTSRLKTQQASVDRIRALMTQAKSITDVTTLESELSRREADLESMQAQQRDLTNLSTLSTITVTLLRTDAPAATPKKPDSGFMAGLKSGWHAFANSLKALLTALGTVLPFVVAIGLPVWFVLYVLRRRRVARPAPEPSEGS
jgi:hypothetical protein